MSFMSKVVNKFVLTQRVVSAVRNTSCLRYSSCQCYYRLPFGDKFCAKFRSVGAVGRSLHVNVSSSEKAQCGLDDTDSVSVIIRKKNYLN